MKFLTPNEVREDGNINEVLRKIKSKNAGLGQYLGAKSNHSDKEKTGFKSQQETLAKYKEAIVDIKKSEKYIKGEGLKEHKLCKQKRGKGRSKIFPDTVIYKNPDDLVIKLDELVIAKEAGSTGLDTTII